MSGSQNWDVVVVGAGPGGSAAACFAARAGLRTLLLERAHFPRDKACGDGVGAGGIAVLRQMGILEELIDAGAGQATGFGIGSPGGASFRHRDIVWESDLEPQPLLIAPRLLLDASCARAAERSGAVLREGVRVQALLREAGRVTGVRLDSGETEMARLVIGADGVRSLVAQELGQLDPDRHHRAFALRTYYRGLRHVGDDAFFIYDRRFMPAYFWIFPLPDGRANVGLGRFDRYAGDDAPPLAGLFERFARENALAAHLLAGGEPEARLRGWPMRLGTSAGDGTADGALLVGDANGFIDPLTGEGIHNALRSGQMAAEVAVAALARNDVSKAGLVDYPRRWRAEFADEFHMADRALDLLMNHDAMTDAVVALARDRREIAVRIGEVFAGMRPKRDLLTPAMLARIGLTVLRRSVTREAPDPIPS